MSKQIEKDAARWRALIEHCRIEHVDDRDMEPVFEVQPPVSWRHSDLTKAIDAVIKESV